MQRAVTASAALRRLLSAAVSSSSSSTSPALRAAFHSRAAISCIGRRPELPECPIQQFLSPTCEFSRGYAQTARRPATKKEPYESDDDDDDDSDDYEGGEWVDDVDDNWDDDDHDFGVSDDSD